MYIISQICELFMLCYLVTLCTFKVISNAICFIVNQSLLYMYVSIKYNLGFIFPYDCNMETIALNIFLIRL